MCKVSKEKMIDWVPMGGGFDDTKGMQRGVEVLILRS